MKKALDNLLFFFVLVPIVVVVTVISVPIAIAESAWQRRHLTLLELNTWLAK